MGFSIAKLTRWLLLAGVALAAAYPAEAQHQRQGQPILFSSTDNDNVSSNAPSLAAKPPGMMDLANAVQSPDLKFDNSSDNTQPPMPPPAISPAQAQQMQRQLDERNNWALSTPEQILGLPTKEKILGIPDRDAAGLPKNETIVEQYYKRQDELRIRTNSVYFGAADAAARPGFSGDQEPPAVAGVLSSAGSRLDNSALVNQFLNGTPGNPAGSAHGPESGWSTPATPIGPTPEQQTAVNQFSQLSQLHLLSSDTAKTPSFGSPIIPPASTAPAVAQPAAIPMGASYTPLSSGIAMPAGVAPLPGLLGPTNVAAPPLAPEWTPPPPPWVSSGPQLGVIPQRKF